MDQTKIVDFLWGAKKGTAETIHGTGFTVYDFLWMILLRNWLFSITSSIILTNCIVKAVLFFNIWLKVLKKACIAFQINENSENRNLTELQQIALYFRNSQYQNLESLVILRIRCMLIISLLQAELAFLSFRPTTCPHPPGLAF